MLSGRGTGVSLVIRPEESYRLCVCVCVCVFGVVWCGGGVVVVVCVRLCQSDQVQQQHSTPPMIR